MLKLGAAYRILGNGEMEGCPQGGCDKSCCMPKPVVDVVGNIKKYTVLLSRQEELGKLEAVHGSLEKIGIDVSTIVIPWRGRSAGQIINKIVLAINGCLEPETGRCKLAEAKPAGCRIYPFYLDSDMTISPACPSAPEIMHCQNNIRRLVRLRAAHGLFDNREWIENGEDVVGRHFNNEPENPTSRD